MKLFLSSMAISEQQAPAFAELVGRQPADIKLLLIENAADVYPDDTTDWVDVNRVAIQSHGFRVDQLDLRDYRGRSAALRKLMSSYDAIWLGGGNTYYLRWILRESGADKIIVDLVSNGLVYGGGSAGAIVAGPTLDHFQKADDPKDAPEVLLDGLALTKTVVVPHADNSHYGPIMAETARLLAADGYKTAVLTDAQALIISGNQQEVI